MQTTYTIVIAIGLLLIMLATYLWRDNTAVLSAAQSTTVVNTVQTGLQQAPPSTLLNNEQDQAEELASSSLADTDVDRAQLSMVNGQLVLSPDILFYFEYFLNMRGEKSQQRIARIAVTDFHQHYSNAIAKVLEDLFTRYCAYRKALAVAMQDLPIDELSVNETTAFNIESKVQPRFFSAVEITHLFIAQQVIFNTPSQAQHRLQRHQEYEQRLKENPEQADAAATEIFGAEAAQRLQTLRHEQAQWQTRLIDYRLQRDAINSNDGLDAYGKKEAVQLLHQRLFDQYETLRVQAIEQQQQLP